MKKRNIFAIAVICVLLCATLIFAACDPKQEDPPRVGVYSISIDFDKSQGSVTLSAPAEGELYYDQEEVTVAVVANEGLQPDAFSVSGHDDASLTDGKYTFKITADTTISVTFKRAQYDVTVTENPAINGVRLSPYQLRYYYGDNVTLRVEPPHGYELDNVFIDGAEVEFDADGKYEFTIEKATNIEVNYTMPLLEDLKGSVSFEGSRLNDDMIAHKRSSATLKTTFDSARKATLMESYENGEPTAVWLFREDTDGQTLQLSHDMYGKLKTVKQRYDFALLYNPFDLLTGAEFAYKGGNKWTINNSATVAAVMEALVGAHDLLDSFTMYEEDGKIAKIEFVCQINEYNFGGEQERYQYTYTLAPTERGTASIDSEYFEDYALEAEHEDLKNAMENANAATSYTVRYKSNSDEYTLYYTSDGIYIQSAKTCHGYFARPDGNVWSYTYTPATQKSAFDGIVDYKDLSALKAVFTISDNKDDYYVLLKNLGDGKFAARAADVYDSYNEVAAFMAMQMATGVTQINEFQAATSFALELSEGALSKVEFDYVIDSFSHEHVTLTFSNWNNTSLPHTVPQEVLDGIIAPAFCGDWATENAETVLSVNLDGMTLNGEKVEAVQPSAENYAFSVKEKAYSVKMQDDKLVLSSDGAETELTKCPWVQYIGTFLGVDEADFDLDIIITASGISVKSEGGDPVKAKKIEFEKITVYDEDGYAEDVYQFSFTLAGDPYVLQQYGASYDELIYAPEGSNQGVGLRRDKYEELTDWSEYLGAYVGEGFNAVISESGITLSKDGATATIDKKDVLFYRDWDYNQRTYYYHFKFTWSGKTCIFETLTNGLLFVVDSDSKLYVKYYLMKQGLDIDYSEYVGTYSADNGEYVFTIASDKISCSLNGTDVGELDVIYFEIDETYGCTIYLRAQNGTIYYLSLWPKFSQGNLSLDSGASIHLSYKK